MYNVAIIGYGYWGPKLARNFQNSNFFNIKYIVDKSNKNLQKARIDHPLCKLLNNYKLINQNDVDLIVIASPTKFHFVIAKYFLKNTNVLIEKPLSLKLKEVKKLELISKKKQKTFICRLSFFIFGFYKLYKENN